MKDDVLCVIPARLGSKGVPRKNLRVVGGQTLLERALDFAHRVSKHVLVTTEAVEVIQHVADYDIARRVVTARICVNHRDVHQDDSRGVDVWHHAWRFAEEAEGRVFEYSLYLEPTSPLREFWMAANALYRLRNTTAAAVWTVEAVPEKYQQSRQFWACNGRAREFNGTAFDTPRQFSQQSYVRNGAIYAAKRSALNLRSVYAPNLTDVIQTDPLVNIDTEADLREAERRLTERARQ